jgi:hypothetical protein
MLMLPFCGATDGALYVVVAPLAVCAELNEPHEGLGVQLHVTPPFAASFDTVAAISTVVFVCIDAGGGVVSTTAIGGGGVTFTLTVADFVLSETEAALMLTLPPWGTAAGAL